MVLFGQHAKGGVDLRQRAAAVQAERGVMIFSGALQLAKLLCGRAGGGGWRRSGQWFFVRRQEVCAFEQAAEIFFAGGLRGAFPGGEADHGLVFHREPSQLHDAEILPVFFPDLALAKFHSGCGW